MKHNIIAYTICYNERKLFPFFIDYMNRFASKIVIYDNESDDGILDDFKKYDNIEVRTFSTDGNLVDKTIQNIKNECWKESIGKCDYVYVGEFDEFLWANDIDKELDYMDEHDKTIIWPEIYQLYCETFPEYIEGKLLHETPKMRFLKDYSFGKRLLFNPNEITSIKYGPGAHTCFPCGNVKYYDKQDIFMFHAKNMSPQYLYDRYLMYNKRVKITEYEKIMHVNTHLLNIEKDKIFYEFQNKFDKAYEINNIDSIL